MRTEKRVAEKTRHQICWPTTTATTVYLYRHATHEIFPSYTKFQMALFFRYHWESTELRWGGAVVGVWWWGQRRRGGSTVPHEDVVTEGVSISCPQ